MTQKEKGFTLLELMIVVAVIGILAAIAIPNITRARLNANEARLKADFKTFATALEAYRAVQNPPSYPQPANTVFTALTTATPAYLDSSWGTGDNITRNGYDLGFATDSAHEYVLYGNPTTANVTGSNAYCIMEDGAVRVTTMNVYDSNGCDALGTIT